MSRWVTLEEATEVLKAPIRSVGEEKHRLAQTVIEQSAALEKAHRQLAAAFEALRRVPGYPHVRTARDEEGDASLAVNIEQLAAELAKAKATISSVQDRVLNLRERDTSVSVAVDVNELTRDPSGDWS